MHIFIQTFLNNKFRIISHHMLLFLFLCSSTFLSGYVEFALCLFNFSLQSMTLKEACKHALTILKQVMEEKLNSTNVEVMSQETTQSDIIIVKLFIYQFEMKYVVSECLMFLITLRTFIDHLIATSGVNCLMLFIFQMSTVTPQKQFHMFTKEELENVIKEI